MSHFKLVVIRTDGISHESEFIGWHAETATVRHMKEARDDKRTLIAVWFEHVTVPTSLNANHVWHVRQIYNATEKL